MTINLNNQSVPAWTGYAGSGRIVIPGGKKLIIETTPQGEEILSVQVPDGKTWMVSISINIVET